MDEKRVLFVSALAAVIFLVHPVQTQAVTYISQRYASFATLFYLSAILSYALARLKGRKTYFVLALLSSLFAMKSKEIAFTLPLLIIVYEFTFFEGPFRKRLLSVIPFIVLLAIIPLSILSPSSISLSPAMMSDIKQITQETTLITRHDYLTTQFRVILTYLRLLILPVNQNLDYDYPIYKTFADPSVFLPALFFLALIVYAIRTNKKNPVISFSILWFFITISVESSIIPIADVINEHRLYLPMTGFAVFSAYMLSRIKPDKIRTAVVIVLIAVLSLVTFERNSIWKSELTLWEDTISKSPHKMRPHANLGAFYLKNGLVDEAITELQAALKYGFDVRAQYNLGVAFYQKGMNEKAVAELKKVIAVSNFADAYNTLGVISAQKGEHAAAINYFEKAISFRPSSAEAYSNLGRTYNDIGELDKSLSSFQKAIELSPDVPSAYYSDLGVVFQRKGNYKAALTHYIKALEINLDDRITAIRIADLFIEQGQPEKGIRFFQSVFGKYKNAASYAALGRIYESSGAFDDAIKAYAAALELDNAWNLPLQGRERIKKSGKISARN